MERQIAILTENFAGKWPFWLSPRQAMVVPVGPPFNEYAGHVQKAMREAGFCCDKDVDDSNTMNKKVRNAQLAQYNFIFGENIQFDTIMILMIKLKFFIKWWARRSAPTTL